MNISQISLLQLVVFLEKQPLNKFPTLQVFNKVNNLIGYLKGKLDTYYTTYEQKEFLLLTLQLPYIKRADELRKNESAAKLSKSLEKLQAEADADTALQAAQKDLNDFRDAEDKQAIEVELPPEEKSAAKELFETYALTYEGWLNKPIVAELSAFLT